MSSILFICSSILDEAGRLHVEREAQLKLLAQQYAGKHRVTVLVQAKRDKTCEALQGLQVCYDPAAPTAPANPDLPTRIQQRYDQFTHCEPLPEAYDWVIAWDGCAPYALATLLRRVNAAHKAALVLDNPSLYLTPDDQNFLFQAYCRLDRIDVSTPAIHAALTDYLRQPLFDLPTPIGLFELPEDWDNMRQKAEAPFVNPYQPDAINLLAVARMTTPSPAEQLPALIAQRRQEGQNVHCYMIGDGPRRPRYWQQIAVWDADDCFTLLGRQENPYPLLKYSNGVFLPDEEPDGPLHKAAQLFGIPVLDISESKITEE